MWLNIINIFLQQSSTGIENHKLIFSKATELMKSIVLSPVPVIAKVNKTHVNKDYGCNAIQQDKNG